MIPVPSYQVVQFLDWLRERQVRLSRERFNRDQLHRLAIEYLRSADIGKGEFARIDLLFLLRVFQSCPMIGESGVLAQMEHFARCGQCMEYIREREHGYLVTGLHPLLRDSWCMAPAVGKHSLDSLCAAADNRLPHGRGSNVPSRAKLLLSHSPVRRTSRLSHQMQYSGNTAVSSETVAPHSGPP